MAFVRVLIMSGHNKWSKIKHKKAAADSKRSNVFSKHLSAISTAAREGGPNPESNPQLRAVISRAKAANVPNRNIENALSRAQSQRDLTEMLVEAHGPEGVGILISASTDNSNRTIAELKKLIFAVGAKYGEQGSVSWGFAQGEDRIWKAKFPQNISVESRESLDRMLAALLDHPDVGSVTSNAA